MPGMPCTICNSPKRAELERAIATGEPIRSIAIRLEVSRPALMRHKNAHLAPAIAAARMTEPAKVDFASGEAVLNEVARLRDEAQRLGRIAESKGDTRTALAAVREQTRIIELLAQLAETAAKRRPPAGDDTDMARLTDAQLDALASLAPPIPAAPAGSTAVTIEVAHEQAEPRTEGAGDRAEAEGV